MAVSADGGSIALSRGADGKTFTAKESYTLSSHGIGQLTRYGFVVHHYGSPGKNDTLVIPAFVSTEFPTGG